MTRLPILKPIELAKALSQLGFVSRTGKGSHVVFKHPDGRYTSIPMHPHPMGKGLLSKILKQLGLTPDQLRKNL